MDNKNKQSTPEDNDPFKPQLHNPPGTKIIQPSDALLEELKNQQAETQNQPQPLAQPPASPSAPQSATPEKMPDAPAASLKPDISKSVYPEATKSVDVSAQIAHPAETKDSSTDKVVIDGKLILTIRIVTSVLLLLQLWSLYSEFAIWRAFQSAITLFALIVGFVVVASLAGILMLKELARVIYIFIAVVSLIIAIVGLTSLYLTYHKSSTYQAQDQQLSRQQIDYSIKATEQNNQYTDEQKKIVINNLKDQPGYSKANDVKLKAKRYITYGVLLLIAIGPIVFYTRPKVKNAFS